METDDPRNMALEELKLLQEIIARHEQHEFRVKGWLFVVMAAYTAAIFTQHLTPNRYVLGAVLFFICGFTLWLTYHRMYVYFALERVNKIERYLRRSATRKYVGPKICKSLAYQKPCDQFRIYFAQLCSRDVLAPLILALACLGIGYWFAPWPSMTSLPASESAAMPCPIPPPLLFAAESLANP